MSVRQILKSREIICIVPDARKAQAVKACVDSYWTEMRSPESVDALLRAGANVTGVQYPCGYAEVDELLRRHHG